jgi:photosystem II stability/assembly factor-like uncharacterized protein
MRRRSMSAATLVCVLVVFNSGSITGQSPRPAAEALAALKFRYIGPVGNRVIAVTGAPGNPHVYYAGAASGGVWKTSDDGAHWEPQFDSQDVQSIGALAVAPSDPSTVWAGTGEAFIRSNISIGNGIYKSVDAGKTWTRMGLERTARIARVIVDPKNADTVFACALGHAYGPQPERGVYKTTDGGGSWTRVLFVDENTGCSDITMDPNNPRVLFAGMWQLEIHTWGRTSGGPGSGLFKSVDGGATWKRLAPVPSGSDAHGLPAAPLGKISPQIARSNSNRVYALIETGDGMLTDNGQKTQSGSLWRSEDGGENWTMVSADRRLRGRTHYYTRFAVSPDNENEAFFLAAEFTKTVDGGQTSIDLTGRVAPIGDNHDMWIDPANGDRMVVAHDDGMSFSINRGKSWHHIQLPIAQMYHVATDNQIPYNVYGNRQDGPSSMGPSNSRLGKQSEDAEAGPIPRGMWHSVAGGESGWAIPDPVDNNIVWATGTGFGSLGGTVERFDQRTRQAREVEIWPEITVGTPAAGVKYRFNWTFPLAISPHDHNTIYAGSQHVHRTTNGGQSWQVISPDLTTGDKSRQQSSGGLTPDNVGVEYAGVVFAIAESPREKGVVWAGTNDGQVQVTRDAGARWTNVTTNMPGLPAWGTVSNIEPSRFDNGSAYVTIDLHQVNNRDPFVYKTTDYGRTWTSIAGGLPKSVHSYAHCVREDPVRKGLLYLGVENGLYFSTDDGQHWTPLQSGLPHAPVHWIAIQEHFNDLVVATYGRGFFILDDVTPLRQLTPQTQDSTAHLFAPRATYRLRNITEPMMMPDDATEGVNPPDGAPITFSLKTAPAKDPKAAKDAKAAVRVVIKDAAGQVVRAIDVKEPKAGLNRVWWNLRGEPTTEVKPRTPPLNADDLKMNADGTRTFAMAGSSRLSALVPPGTFTVTLEAPGASGPGATTTQQLTVRKDPNTAGTDADIQAQTKTIREVHDGMNKVADLINRAEAVRAQIGHVKTFIGDDAAAKELVAAGEDLDKRVIAVEERLFNLNATGRGQDFLRHPSQLMEKLAHLADTLQYADFAPTDQQLEVHKLLTDQVAEAATDLGAVVSKDVTTFNEMLRRRNIGTIVVR